MKRFIILITVACLVTAIFAACGGGQSAPAAPQSAAQAPAASGGGGTAAAETPSSELPFVELKYYIRAQEQDNSAPVQAAMDEYFIEKLNCTVTVIPVNEWMQVMPLTLASGEQVDLTYDQSNTGFYSNVANNIYLPLNDLFETYAQDTIAAMAENTPGIMEVVKVNGVVYGIPCQKQTPQSEAWYFRKDIVEKYDFDIDSLVTLQDMEKLHEVIKENEPDFIPYWVREGTGVHMEWTTEVIKDDPRGYYEQLTGAINLLVVDLKTGKVMNVYETEWDLDRYTTLKRWQDLGYINSDAATSQENGADLFRAGRTWFIGGGGSPTTMAAMQSNYGVEFVRWRCTPPIVNTYQNVTALTCIPRATVDADRAMMVINLFHTDKYIVDLFNSGIEGTNYVIDENGRFSLPPGATSQRDTGYQYGFETFFGNMFLNTLWDIQPADRYTELKEYNQTSPQSKIMGFYVDLSNIQNEYAAVEAVRVQYAPILRGGVANDVQATLNELNEKMYANGLQKVIDEAQRQYDEFVS